MPTFIKTGFWEKTEKELKNWLNLDRLIQSKITPSIISSTVSTTDGVTWTTIATETFTQNGAFIIETLNLLGKSTVLDICSRSTAYSAIATVNSGVITWYDGSTSTIDDNLTTTSYSTGTLAPATWRLSISGNSVNIQVKGVIATNINWSIKYIVNKV